MDHQQESQLLQYLSTATSFTTQGADGDSSSDSSAADNLSLAPHPRQWDVPLSDVTVWVDPLDGTKEILDGNLRAVTVLIGIAMRGKPAAGIVYQPFWSPSCRRAAGDEAGADESLSASAASGNPPSWQICLSNPSCIQHNCQLNSCLPTCIKQTINSDQE